MKGCLRAMGLFAMAIGAMAIETYDMAGVEIAVAGMALVVACFWHDTIEDIRAENRRRNREWRKRSETSTAR